MKSDQLAYQFGPVANLNLQIFDLEEANILCAKSNGAQDYLYKISTQYLQVFDQRT